jgi:hypothetical protein
MAIPTWITGEVLTASDVNRWFVPLAIKKTSNTSRSSTTSITSDPQLVLAMDVNADYKFEALVLYDGASGGDIQFRFAVPTGATMNFTAIHDDASSTHVGFDIVYNNGSILTCSATGAGNSRGLSMTGMVTTANTAGNLTFQWGQNTSNGTATTVEVGSYMYLQRCG